MKSQIKKLEERFVNAETDAERAAIRGEIRELCDKEAAAVAAAALEGIREVNTEATETLLREKLREALSYYPYLALQKPTSSVARRGRSSE